MVAKRAAFCLVAASLFSSGAERAATEARPNVILLTIDTLRADRLGCYGYRRIQTPSIDSLAAEGIRFKTVVAQVPLTLPSHCTILTGTYPMFHRMSFGDRLLHLEIQAAVQAPVRAPRVSRLSSLSPN